MDQQEILRRAVDFCSADIADAAVSPQAIRGLKRWAGHGAVQGWVRTVRAVRGDARGVHEAVLRAERGDVLVVDFGGPDVPAAGLGELVCAEAVRRGVVAIVLWGPMRDVAAIGELDLTVFATGTEPMPGIHLVAGEQATDIEVGGATVREGDLFIADDDGLIVVGSAEAAEAVERAELLRTMDRGIAAAVLAGSPLADHPDYRAYVDAVDERRAAGSMAGHFSVDGT